MLTGTQTAPTTVAASTIPSTLDVPDLNDHRGPVEISPRELPHRCPHNDDPGYTDLFHRVCDVAEAYPEARILSVVVSHERVHASAGKSGTAAGVLREALAGVPDAAILVAAHQGFDCHSDESAQLVFVLDRSDDTGVSHQPDGQSNPSTVAELMER